MTDGFNCLNVATNPDNLIENPLLWNDWQTTVKTQNGDIRKEFVKYFGLIFSIRHGKDKNVRLYGSFHKYHNQGEHNYNDFHVEEVKEVVNEICQKFDIDAERTELNNLEFGLNIVLPFPTSLVLDNLNSYKGKLFERIAEEGMNYYQCKNAQFYIKIYDKGKQYNLPENILRFEIKVIKKQYFAGFGIPIYWLSDLFNDAIYPKLGDLLTSTFNEILFNDNRIDCSNLSQQEQIIYYKGINPKSWEGKTTNDNDRKKRQRAKEVFKTLLEKYRNGDDFKAITMKLMREKVLQLSRSYRKIEQEIAVTLTAEKMPHVPFLHLKYNVYLGQDKIKQEKVKLCSGCGKPIEPDKLYHSLECKLRRDERNTRSNDRNNFKKRYRKLVSKPSLFDVMTLLKLTDKQKNWIGT